MNKLKNLRLQAMCLLLCCAGLAGCLNDNEPEGRQVTGYEEYALTVASKKLPGLAGQGSNVLTEVYAVKKEGATEWEELPAINGFDYENGYEYRIRISETSYLDKRMGTPAWTEHDLLEIISKEKKDSEGLPADFIPAWYQDAQTE